MERCPGNTRSRKHVHCKNIEQVSAKFPSTLRHSARRAGHDVRWFQSDGEGLERHRFVVIEELGQSVKNSMQVVARRTPCRNSPVGSTPRPMKFIYFFMLLIWADSRMPGVLTAS